MHRIVNDRDQELVRRLVPELAGALLKDLPSLPAQQAILIGIATEIPVVVDIKELPEEQRPRSRNPDLWDVWTAERPLQTDFDANPYQVALSFDEAAMDVLDWLEECDFECDMYVDLPENTVRYCFRTLGEAAAFQRRFGRTAQRRAVAGD